MGANLHFLRSTALHSREAMVVQPTEQRKLLPGQTMTNSKKTVRGLDWATIFERRPDLKPPGFEETCEAIAIKYNRHPSQLKQQEKLK